MPSTKRIWFTSSACDTLYLSILLTVDGGAEIINAQVLQGLQTCARDRIEGVSQSAGWLGGECRIASVVTTFFVHSLPP